MEPRAMIGRNLDTCKRGPLANYNNLSMNIGRTRWQVGEQAIAKKHKHTHTHTHRVSLVIQRMDGASSKDQTQFVHM